VKIIATGASGLFGTSLREMGRSNSDISIHPVSRNERPPSPERWLVLDETLEESCADLDPDVIVHAAAESSPAACESDPSAAHAANVQLTERIVAIARNLGVPCVFLSTDLVFDGTEDAPHGGFEESDPPNPLSTYAKTKVLAEEIALSYSRTTVLRISLLIGEGVSADMGFRGYVRREWRSGRPLRLFVDEWRTVLSAKECADGVLRCCRLGLTGRYHFGGVRSLSRYELGEALAREDGVGSELLHRARRAEFSGTPRRPANVSLNSTRFRLAVGLPEMEASPSPAGALPPSN
jgi:dTDP-4-dehydrorhamnose reductase